VKQVCDTEEKRLAHMKKLYPSIATTTKFDDLVNDKEIDAIVVATPVHLHHGLGKKSLLAGKHTFIEKPMATSSAACEELVSLAAKKNLTLMVGHTFIYSTPVRRIKEIVDSGEIGEVQYISSRRLNLGLFQKDINVTWDLAPHDISIILYLIGRPPVSVNCQGNVRQLPGESTCEHVHRGRDQHVSQFRQWGVRHHPQQLARPQQGEGDDHRGEQEDDRLQ
jgi:predicted dehydrogenase